MTTRPSRRTPPGLDPPVDGTAPSPFPGFRDLDQRGVVASLAAYRRSQGLSQTEVAARMGTSQSAVARIENGEADVRISTLERYAEALGQQLTFGVAASTPQAATREDPEASA